MDLMASLFLGSFILEGARARNSKEAGEEECFRLGFLRSLCCV